VSILCRLNYAGRRAAGAGSVRSGGGADRVDLGLFNWIEPLISALCLALLRLICAPFGRPVRSC